MLDYVRPAGCHPGKVDGTEVSVVFGSGDPDRSRDIGAMKNLSVMVEKALRLFVHKEGATIPGSGVNISAEAPKFNVTNITPVNTVISKSLND